MLLAAKMTARYLRPRCSRRLLGAHWELLPPLGHAPGALGTRAHQSMWPTYSGLLQSGRVRSSNGVSARYVLAAIWANVLVRQATVYSDVHAGGAAAERLAEERRRAMSQKSIEVAKLEFQDGKCSRRRASFSRDEVLKAVGLEE